MSPITADRRLLYPPDWPTISRRIKQAAGWVCQRCQAPHGEPNPVTGSKVVLTTHHKDADPSNCEDANLEALCQLCHNRADAAMRTLHRALTMAAKRDAGPWLPGLQPENLYAPDRA
jgi:5-methylcytosine-specific restriction endonuclease McrA